MTAYIRRRPYHAGSLLGPAPTQAINAQQLAEWQTRIRAYWNRPNAKAGEVARALVAFLGPDGALMPSLQTLADRVRCSVKSIGRWIKAMHEAGFLRAIRRRTPFGQTSSAYLILLPDQDPPASPAAPVGEPLKLSLYKDSQDSDEESSMDSLPSDGRAAALRRLNGWLGAVIQAVRPAPQAPRYTPEEQIAIMRAQDRLIPG